MDELVEEQSAESLGGGGGGEPHQEQVPAPQPAVEEPREPTHRERLNNDPFLNTENRPEGPLTPEQSAFDSMLKIADSMQPALKERIAQQEEKEKAGSNPDAVRWRKLEGKLPNATVMLYKFGDTSWLTVTEKGHQVVGDPDKLTTEYTLDLTPSEGQRPEVIAEYGLEGEVPITSERADFLREVTEFTKATFREIPDYEQEQAELRQRLAERQRNVQEETPGQQ